MTGTKCPPFKLQAKSSELHHSDSHARRILSVVEQGKASSQRSISRELGIALGLANILVVRLAKRGLIRLVRVRPSRVLYLITPAGIAEKARLSVNRLVAGIESYVEMRDRIRESFARLSSAWPPGLGTKRIVFLGTGEVAEIGFVCLQDTDLNLVAVVELGGGTPRARFLHREVHEFSSVTGETVGGIPYDRLLVMSFVDAGTTLSRLSAAGVPAEKVGWLI